jgi:hypothetical protein
VSEVRQIGSSATYPERTWNDVLGKTCHPLIVEARSQPAWLSPRRVAFAVAATLFVALAAIALGLFLWARSYTPLALSATASSIRGRVPALSGQGFSSTQHYLLRPGTREVEYGLVNDGRWAIEVDRLSAVPAAPGEFTVQRVVANAFSIHERPLPTRGWQFRIGPHDGAGVGITFRLRCVVQPRGTFSLPVIALRVHYRYLRVFERTQDVPLHDAMTLAC